MAKVENDVSGADRADQLVTTKFDEVSCKQLANCGWPECECPRNDKHSPEAVAYAFTKARELLVAAGFEETAAILHDCRPALCNSHADLVRALEEIAADQKIYIGHGDYREEPLPNHECQRIARAALATLTARKAV